MSGKKRSQSTCEFCDNTACICKNCIHSYTKKSNELECYCSLRTRKCPKKHLMQDGSNSAKEITPD